MGFFENLFGRKNYSNCYTPIIRKRIIEGICLPSFIKKENKYVFSDFEIFEDGIFYCDDFVDLPLLKERLEEQWLNYQVPEKEKIIIPGLGQMRIKDAKWLFKDNKSFLKTIKKYLKELNPSMKNLYSFFGDNTHEINKIRVPVFRRNSYPIAEEEVSQINTKQIKGKSVYLFCKENGKTFLAQLTVFKNATVRISFIPSPLIGKIDELENMFKEGSLKTTLQNNEQIAILGLGEFTVEETQIVTFQEKIEEIKQLYRTLN